MENEKQLRIDNVTFDELRREIRFILREELGNVPTRDEWVVGETYAAKALGISVPVLSNMVSDGKLKGCVARIGGRKLNFNVTKIRSMMTI